MPLDGSAFAERALPVASRLARRLDVDVHLFSAVPKREKLAQRDALLEAAHLPGIPGPRVHRMVVVDPDPAGAIHAGLRRIAGGLACMASHGRGRSAALVGSIATEVIARGHDPLVLVGPSNGDIAPWIDEKTAWKGVVACVDDRPVSADLLLPVALCWSALLEEPAVAVTVAEPVPAALDDRPERRRFGPPGNVEAFLEALVAPWRAAGQRIATKVVYDPISPASGLRDHLREDPASVVVAASHARTGVERVTLGSVAASIVHQSPSPVLVVPRWRPGAAEEV